MTEAFDTIKDTWARTFAAGLIALLLLVLVVGVSLVVAAPSSRESISYARPDKKPPRNRLRICYFNRESKTAEISKSDMERIARSYNLLKNEKADFEGILRLNEKCKPSPTAEALICTAEPCAPPKGGNCPSCVLWVPMRD